MKSHGIVSLIGETNSGKSTLVNALVKDKVSIVSHKVQTTRNQILGIYTNNDNQLVFVDTPGVFAPKKNLDSFMIRLAYSSLLEADIILVLLDANKGITNIFETLLQRLESFKDKNIILVLNKIDLISKESKTKLLDISDSLYKKGLFKAVFMISALRKNGLQDLINYLISNISKKGWMFDEEQTSNISLNFWAAEITREKIYKYLHQELPYVTIVQPLLWQETDNSIIIKQDIVVSKPSHKKMVIGKNGINIKRIGTESRKEIEYNINKKVHLYLFVKVEENLINKEELFTNNSFLLSK